MAKRPPFEMDCGRTFRNKTEMLAAVEEIRSRPTGPLTGGDLEFLLEYYSYHDSPNHQLPAYSIDVVPPYTCTKSGASLGLLYAHIRGGSSQLFGWKRPAEAIWGEGNLSRSRQSKAYRVAVWDQTHQYKLSRRQLRPDGSEFWLSDLPGSVAGDLTNAEAHVDHNNEFATLRELICWFEAEFGVPEMAPLPAPQRGLGFVDPAALSAWRGFHKANARLRILSAGENVAREQRVSRTLDGGTSPTPSATDRGNQ